MKIAIIEVYEPESHWERVRVFRGSNDRREIDLRKRVPRGQKNNEQEN
ncbi:MAG TPA: hypothetical protein VMU48_12100 [Terracidiphilus sp.]|nr:hypothetical protein [Terracidiphilus sp.]